MKDRKDREIEYLRGLLSLMSPAVCENLHHGEKDRHRYDEACPVETKFQEYLCGKKVSE